MDTKRNLTWAITLLAILIIPLSTSGQCTRDIDCKGDRICVDGECVSPDEGGGSPETTPAAKKNAGPMGKGYVNFHPLGLLQFGPLVQLGINAGKDLFITAHYRYHALGLVSQAIAWGYDADYAKWSSMALGAGVTKCISFSGGPHRFYAGGMVDFGWGGSVADDADWEDYKWESDVLSLAFVGNTGYRFRFPSGFMLGLGGFAGLGFELMDEVTYTETPLPPDVDRHESADKNLWPFIMLEVSLGIEFGREGAQ
jgi:hypothetical protein